MSLKNDSTKYEVIKKFELGYSVSKISEILDIPKQTLSDFLLRKTWKDFWVDFDERVDSGVFGPCGPIGPKILVLDIETAPMRGAIWRLFKTNVGLDQIEQDWYVIAWAAKWMHEDEVFYQDKRDSWKDEDDRELLEGIWKLIDEADIIVTQNGKRFDEKKLNARFVMQGFKPPSSYRHIDTLEIAKRHFSFTSNKLEYMTDKLCKKYKKKSHEKFPGYLLWKECLEGNIEAWKEMEEYNIFDVLSLEELYTILRPWFKNHPNINVYYEDNEIRCRCGSTSFEHNGYRYTNLSKFDRFRCKECGAETAGRVNLLPKNKRKTLRANIL